MPITSTAELLALLNELPLVSAAQRQQLGKAPALPDAAALARALVAQKWLTAYQADQLVAGNGRDLVLDQHVLLEQVGEGGMGQVFKARHLRLERLEAVKILRREYLDTPEAVQRFLREARAVARLDHPHIVRIHDASEIDGRPFLAMEFLAGVNLAHLVERDGALPPEQVPLLLYQAALGLQHAHENGLVHRDIKPHNLFLTGAVSSSPRPAERILKILDLGLVRLQPLAHSTKESSLTPSGLVMGTPDYIAPEQSRNHRNADIRSDLYSLGCTGYYLLAGHPPFVGGGMMEKLLCHQMEPPPPVEQVCPETPPRLAAVIGKLLEKDPGQRYQTPAELAAALKPLRRAAPLKTKRKPSGPARPNPPMDTISAPPLPDTVAFPPPQGVRCSPPTSRKRGMSEGMSWVLAGAIALLVVIVLAVLLLLLR